MHLEYDMSVTCGISRVFHFLKRVLQVSIPGPATTTGTIGVDNKVALGIISSRGTNRTDKALDITVDGIVGIC